MAEIAVPHPIGREPIPTSLNEQVVGDLLTVNEAGDGLVIEPAVVEETQPVEITDTEILNRLLKAVFLSGLAQDQILSDQLLQQRLTIALQ